MIHPNLVRLYELVGTEGDRVFFSMELVRGTDFLRHVQRTGTAPRLDESGVHAPGRRGARPRRFRRSPGERRHTPADFDRLLPALRQLVEGVQALHDAGKLHRDIKPSNVLVSTEGRVVLLDFGVATDLRRAADRNAARRRADGRDGDATWRRSRRSSEAPTVAADWYSVGVMLYEALVGVPPFVGSAVDVIQRKNDDATRDRRPRCVDGVPPELDALCRALLDRAPERRPERAGDPASGSGPAAPRADPPRTRPGAVSLVGREAQVAELEAALARARGAGASRCA